jgi:hypothetical protein
MTKIEIDVEGIMSRDDLILFLEKLSQNFEDEPERWENHRLDQFLEALAGGLGDYEGAYLNRGVEVPRVPTWKFFGEMLLAARTYE